MIHIKESYIVPTPYDEMVSGMIGNMDDDYLDAQLLLFSRYGRLLNTNYQKITFVETDQLSIDTYDLIEYCEQYCRNKQDCKVPEALSSDGYKATMYDLSIDEVEYKIIIEENPQFYNIVISEDDCDNFIEAITEKVKTEKGDYYE